MWVCLKRPLWGIYGHFKCRRPSAFFSAKIPVKYQHPHPKPKPSPARRPRNKNTPLPSQKTTENIDQKPQNRAEISRWSMLWITAFSLKIHPKINKN
jgi:hypothetical protein